MVEKLLEAGPHWWLAAASIILNVGLLGAIWALFSGRLSETKDVVAALTLSTRAIEAASADRRGLTEMVQENHSALMIAIAKLETALAMVRADRGAR